MCAGFRELFPDGYDDGDLYGYGRIRDMSTCSFAVLTFDLCVQDDSDPTKVVLVNTATGAYRFCCGGNAFTGTGTVTVRGNLVTVQHNNTNRRVLIKVDRGTNQGPPRSNRRPGASYARSGTRT